MRTTPWSSQGLTRLLVRQVDVWALGVSAIEMAEVTPPRWAVHPMRVIFMIPREPSPQLSDKRAWSPAFHSFLAAALRKVGSWRAAL